MLELIEIKIGRKSMPAELYAPAGTTARGAIIIAHGTDGLTDHLNGPWATTMRDYAISFESERIRCDHPRVFHDHGYVAWTSGSPSNFALPR